jgi:hypothetical protein
MECTSEQTASAQVAGLYRVEAPRLRDRFAARWQSRRLDRELAAGTPPGSGSAIALRARWLTDLSRRRALAKTLTRIVDGVHDGSASYTRITPSRRRVHAARAELRRLADALADPGPVRARGAAQARILLTDGTGPLYNARSVETVRVCAIRATENLLLP